MCGTRKYLDGGGLGVTAAQRSTRGQWKKEGRLEPENFMVESSAIIVVIVITIIVIQWGQLSSPAPSAIAASPLERSKRGQW